MRRAVDLFLFAPVGLLFEAPHLLPRLVDRGRREAATLVEQGMGMFGFHGSPVGEREGSHLSAALRSLGLVGDMPPEGSSTVGPDAAGGSPGDGTGARGPAPAPEEGAGVPEPAETGAGAAGRGAGGPDPASLAIPDYESLSASQVIPRLASLTPEELESIRRFEVANRHRSTILGKITQLQGG